MAGAVGLDASTEGRLSHLSPPGRYAAVFILMV